VLRISCRRPSAYFALPNAAGHLCVAAVLGAAAADRRRANDRHDADSRVYSATEGFGLRFAPISPSRTSAHWRMRWILPRASPPDAPLTTFAVLRAAMIAEANPQTDPDGICFMETVAQSYNESKRRILEFLTARPPSEAGISAQRPPPPAPPARIPLANISVAIRGRDRAQRYCTIYLRPKAARDYPRA